VAHFDNEATPSRDLQLDRLVKTCPYCSADATVAYRKRRRILTLTGPVDILLTIRRCSQPQWAQCLLPMHPELEGRLALDYMKFGLDVLGLVGCITASGNRRIRFHEMRSMFAQCGVNLARRSIHNLRNRYRAIVWDCVYDELAVRERTKPQGVAVLDISQLKGGFGFPGHWLIREWLSGDLLTLKPATEPLEVGLESAIDDATKSVEVPVTGFITDGSPDVVRYFERRHWLASRPILHIPLASVAPR